MRDLSGVLASAMFAEADGCLLEIDSAADNAPGPRRLLPDGCADAICDFAGALPRLR